MMKTCRRNRPSQSGNIFFMLFASVALVGAFGVAASNTMKGMVASMSDVTRKTIAEEKMMAGGRLAIQDATATQANAGDCDSDGTIEPLPYRSAGTGPKPTGGGYIPLEIGATETDPWGTSYGYCVWDSGSLIKDATCGGAGALRLAGAPNPATHAVIAVISAGKDRKFTTSCNAYVDTTPADGNPDVPLIARTAGGDDVIMEYTYNDASGLSGDDLWKIRDITPDTATIDKNIEVGGGAGMTGPLELQKKGLLLPDDPGDDSVTGACGALNDQELRINSGNNPPLLEICYDNAWEPISMEGSGACGENWTAVAAAQANEWYSIAYGNGIFVAISGDGTNRVMTSTDGMTWTTRTAAEVAEWRDVTFSGGKFVAVASLSGTNRVMTSSDGITWTAQTPAIVQQWYSITHGNGLFVAVSYAGANRVMTSPDGINWTLRTAPEVTTWSSVAYGNGTFVAVGNIGTNRVMTSTDGITWTARTAAEANSWESVAYGNGLFVAVASSGTNRVMTSPDGITWTARAAAEANEWRGVTYGPGMFVAVARTGTNRVMTSPDGITWTARAAAEANSWQNITHGNNRLVAVARDGTNRIMVSTCIGTVGEEDPYIDETAVEAESILPDPVAQYQLDEISGTTIYDSRNGLSGTLAGATNPTSVTGRAGKAIDFDGTDDRVSVAAQSSISGLTAMTISGWLRQDIGSTTQIIYTTRNSGTNGVDIYTDSSPGRLNFNAGASGRWYVDAAFTIGSWAHFAITYDTTNFTAPPTFYINGVTMAPTASTAPSAYTTGNGAIWIASSATPTYFFNGALDDIRIYNRILNPAQIELLYKDLTSGASIAPNPAIQIAAAKGRAMISAGNTNACVIRPDGTAACWGAEATGALGNGAVTADQDSPSRVETLTTPNNFVQISAGWGFACGLKVDGSAWCWGDDGVGELGNGATMGQQDTPSPVAGGHVFSMISVYDIHACGLRVDGQILCWGNDTNGQLGNAGGAGATSPGVIADAGPWASVTVGHSHTCGIKTDGSAWCWGNSSVGRLGEGTLAATNVQSPKPIAQAGPWVKLDAGFNNTCGIKLDGTAWCWGSNSYGKLGIGQTAGNYATPQRVNDLGPWIDIDAGNATTTCGIKLDGTAWCWGDDAVGQLGNGATTGSKSTPSMVTDPGPWASVVSSSTFSCGTKVDGSAWCWGDDTNGRLGNGAVLTATQTSPTRVLYSPDDPAFSLNTAGTALVKNANALSISLGTAGRIGYDGMSGFGFNAAGNPVMSGPGYSTGLGVEAVGAYDAQISLKTPANDVLSIGVDSTTGNLEFGMNNASATDLMSAITPLMEVSQDAYLGVGTGGTVGAKLDINNGGLKVGNDTRDCTLSRKGVLRFNSNKMQYCNGSAWTDL